MLSLSQLLSSLLPFLVIVPVLIAVFLYVFASMRYTRAIAVIVQAIFLIPTFLLLFVVREAEIVVSVGNYPGFLGIILRADSLAATFVFLTVIIFLAVSILTIRMPPDPTTRLFLFLLFLLEAVIIGLFLTRDFFNVFVLVEVSTVVVTIMLMYDRARRNLYSGMTFILVNIVIMQFYLFGLGYIYMLTGVLDMAAAAVAIAALDETAVALPYALIMTSIASKCSLLPMLTWLPKVNSLSGARSTVSAIMSGLHIKSGIYLFIRFQDIFGGMATDLFLILGIFTAVSGILLALAQTDMRLILAYSTIAQVGLIVAGLSLGTGYSRIGSQFHIVNHALFKVALFLCSGRIFFAYQTYDVRKIRGLLRTYPAMAWATILAILGIIGAPLFNGSMSKYLMLAGTSGVLEWIFILINLGTILVFVRFSAMLFGSPIKALPKTATDYYGLSVIFVLGIACLALGVLGVPAVGLLFNESVSFDIWGYLEKTAIFAVSLALGIILYKTVLSKRDILSSLNGLRLSFQKLIVSVCIVFAAILIYVGTVYG